MLCLRDSIRHDDPRVQQLLSTIEEAQTLTQLILAVWPLARVLALHIVEYVLAERAQRPIAWPPCPRCGTALRSKGFAQRQLTSLFGPLRWRRRVGRCPHGCDIPQVAPLDEALGVQPYQRTSGEIQFLGCALAVFVPFATAARLLGWYGGGVVSPRAVWCWVQAAGHQAMEHIQEDLAAVARGHEPTPEPLTAEQVALPLALGADGVMVPFRPTGGQPTGKIRWQEIKVGVLARLGQHRTRTGKVVTRRHHRRLVAVLGVWMRCSLGCGLKPCARVSARRRRWSGSVMAPAGCGGRMRSAWRPTPWASWTFTTPRSTCGRGQPRGWTAAPPRRGGGLAGDGTGCGRGQRAWALRTLAGP